MIWSVGGEKVKDEGCRWSWRKEERGDAFFEKKKNAGFQGYVNSYLLKAFYKNIYRPMILVIFVE